MQKISRFTNSYIRCTLIYGDNRQCMNLKLNSEGILRYFSNKSIFNDKLRVSFPECVGNYLICMHCFETNTFAFLDMM